MKRQSKPEKIKKEKSTGPYIKLCFLNAYSLVYNLQKVRNGGADRMTDEEYYRRYLEGDETGLDELMKIYGNPLTLYINGYLRDIHDAEDLMIEVFAYLFTKKPKIRDGGLKAY